MKQRPPLQIDQFFTLQANYEQNLQQLLLRKPNITNVEFDTMVSKQMTCVLCGNRGGSRFLYNTHLGTPPHYTAEIHCRAPSPCQFWSVPLCSRNIVVEQHRNEQIRAECKRKLVQLHAHVLFGCITTEEAIHTRTQLEDELNAVPVHVLDTPFLPTIQEQRLDETADVLEERVEYNQRILQEEEKNNTTRYPCRDVCLTTSNMSVLIEQSFPLIRQIQYCNQTNE